MVFKRGRRALKTLRTFKTLRSYSKVVGFTGATGAWGVRRLWKSEKASAGAKFANQTKKSILEIGVVL